MSNDILLEREEALSLYERYGVLLTERERSLFHSYYSCDLSLSEIAENEFISRAAVSDSLGKSLSKMRDYEEKLGLLKINQRAEALLEKAKSGSEETKNKALTELSELITHGL